MDLPNKFRLFVRVTVTVLTIISLLPVFLSGAGNGERTWTTSTFLEFSEGRLDDGGVNTYVTAAGEVQLINRYDLNRDGFLDVVMVNTHDNNEQIDLFIYWGIEDSQAGHRTRLPSDGGVAQTIADLNGDGHLDLVVANRHNGVKQNLNSYVYWGSQEGFAAERRLELPTLGAVAVAAHDLNGDGHPDLVFANSSGGRDQLPGGGNNSYLYWGSSDGFSPERRDLLPTRFASDVQISDLNADSYPEIVFANAGSGNDPGGMLIYWGDREGAYGERQRSELPGERSSSLAIADLNGDGISEIVLANRYRPVTREPGDIRELDTDVLTDAISSSIYWGDDSGYAVSRKTDLPTLSVSGVCVGDLNQDGLRDLVFSNGPAKSGHSAPSPGAGSYIYWNDSRGFQPHRRTILPTLNPTDCLTRDLNRDGYADLVFSNENDARSHSTRSYVYWGGPQGFQTSRRLELPTLGAASVGAADFDSDGKMDLVFINRVDGVAGDPMPAYLYWGAEEGQYSVHRRSILFHRFGSPGEGYANADVNNDGFVDIYMGGAESAIYWGAAEGFSTQNMTVVSPRMVFNGRFADFNRDGYLDLVLSEYATGGETGLYWGGPMGFAANNRFLFQVEGPRCQGVADLNGDGYLDLVFPSVSNHLVIFWNGPQGFDNDKTTRIPAGRYSTIEIADLDGNGYLDLIGSIGSRQAGDEDSYCLIYWGGPDGYSASRKLALPTVGTGAAAVADLNGDGRLDIVFGSYHAGETRSHPSYIFWNSAEGFDPSRFTLIPTHSACGILAADFNQDRHPDLLFACHRVDGNHRNDSFLYWGGPKGFSTERRSLLPGLGPHFFTVSDIGNVADRSDRYHYTSAIFDAGETVQFTDLGWDGDTPFATGLEFQVRAARSEQQLSQASWQGPSGKGSHYRDRHSKLVGSRKVEVLSVSRHLAIPQRCQYSRAALRLGRLSNGSLAADELGGSA